MPKNKNEGKNVVIQIKEKKKQNKQKKISKHEPQNAITGNESAKIVFCYCYFKSYKHRHRAHEHERVHQIIKIIINKILANLQK